MRAPLKRMFLAAWILLLIGTMASHGAPLEVKILPAGSNEQISENDQPASNTRARADTIWYGGYDGSTYAVEGGVWDWDTAPLGNGFQGWTFVDMTSNPGIYFARVNSADFTAHGDPCTPMIQGTAGQIWCGIHEDEADQRDFVAGMGYQNYMKQRARSPAHAIDPLSDAIDIQFKYFNHTETNFDFTVILVLCYDSSSQLIQEYEIARLDSIHGSYTTPATFGSGSVEVPAGTLNSATASVRLELRVEADGSISDEDGGWDSPCGPFAADDITIQVGASSTTYNFNVNAQGWTFDRYGVVGTYSGILNATTRQAWLDSAGVDTCGLSGNSLEFVDEVGSPFSPPGHPSGHSERGVSCIVVGPSYGPPYEETVVRWKSYLNLPIETGTVYRIGFHYYPYVSAANPVPHWSPRFGSEGWLYWQHAPRCRVETFNLTTLSGLGGTPLPDDWEMLKVTFEVYCDCDVWWPGCTSEGDTKGSPVIDDLRVGVINSLTGVPPGTLGPSSVESALVLEPNIPNPFGPETAIRYSIPQAGRTSLTIYDAAGRLVRRLADRPQAPGRYVLVWDGRDDLGQAVASGVYFYRLKTDSDAITRKMTVLK